MSKSQYNAAQAVIAKFGGQTELAALLGKRQSTVQHWAKTGIIPSKWHGRILELAVLNGLLLREDEFVSVGVEGMGVRKQRKVEEEATEPTSGNLTTQDGIPQARWPGVLAIGDQEIQVYVLDNGMRVMSQRGAVKAIAGVETGKAGNYLSIPAIIPYLNKDLVAGENVVFSIHGIPGAARGIDAETFIDVCKAYVGALRDGKLATDRQRETAINCSSFVASCAKVGLIALIDEATGYQYERAEDALQAKLRLFLEEEMRKWEKTFPDQLWVEFGRLTNWRGAIHSRPKYWGLLVMELVYGYLDKDVAEWLRTNAPAPQKGRNYRLRSNLDGSLG